MEVQFYSGEVFFLKMFSQPSVNLGIFNVRVITVTKSGATVVEVNSTATVSQYPAVSRWCKLAVH